MTGRVQSEVPTERLRAMIRLLWPDEITPIAKRQLESLCDAADEDAGIPNGT